MPNHLAEISKQDDLPALFSGESLQLSLANLSDFGNSHHGATPATTVENALVQNVIRSVKADSLLSCPLFQGLVAATETQISFGCLTLQDVQSYLLHLARVRSSTLPNNISLTQRSILSNRTKVTSALSNWL